MRTPATPCFLPSLNRLPNIPASPSNITATNLARRRANLPECRRQYGRRYGLGGLGVRPEYTGEITLEVANSPFVEGHGVSETPICAPILGMIEALGDHFFRRSGRQRGGMRGRDRWRYLPFRGTGRIGHERLSFREGGTPTAIKMPVFAGMANKKNA